MRTGSALSAAKYIARRTQEEYQKFSIARFAARIPRAQLSECKYAVAWMVRNWKGKGRLLSYTGGFFRDGELCYRNDTTNYHNVAVLKLLKAFYIVDPTIKQFDPKQSLVIIKTAPNEETLIQTLKDYYGGFWYQI